MNKKPSISFVMPVYNGSAYIANSLNSLIEQTLKNIEIIVVDDGSMDSIEPLKKYYMAKDSRIVWHTLAKNMGVGYARNTGNGLARADIIAVNDSDDLSMPDRAKTLYDYFKKNPKTTLIHTGFSIIDEEGSLRSVSKVIPFDIQVLKDTSMCYICHSTVAYRKSILKDIAYAGDEFSRLGLDDWKFQIDCYKKGYISKDIDKELVLYRYMNTGLSGRRDEEEVKTLKKKYIDSIGGL